MAAGAGKSVPPGVGRDTSAAFPPSAGLRLSLPQDLHPDPQEAPGKLPAFPQPPLPFAEHSMSPKCSLRASKECPGASPDPQKVENHGRRAPPCSGNGSSLVSPSIRGLPKGEHSRQSPGWICFGQGPHYGLRWCSPCARARLRLSLQPPPLPHPPPLPLS